MTFALHLTLIMSTILVGVPGFPGSWMPPREFVRSHGSILELSPLQTYGSALVFDPAIGEVKYTRWKERLPSIETITDVRKNWDIYQQILEGHGESVTAIAFSPDGKTITSASADHTVRLWDNDGCAPADGPDPSIMFKLNFSEDSQYDCRATSVALYEYKVVSERRSED